MHGRKNRQDGGWGLVLWAGLAAAGASLGAAQAQDAAMPQPAKRVEPLDITGTNFAGLRLPVSVNDGAILLKGTRAWSWTGSAGPDGIETRRVLLSGDVSVKLGTYEFQAARAAVWMAPLPPGDPEAGAGVWQVFVFLDRAWTPTEDVAVGVTGDRVPVQGIMRTGGDVRLQAVIAMQELPGEADWTFVREGERALAMRLRTVLTGKAPPPMSPDELAIKGQKIPPLNPGLDRSFQVRPSDDPKRVREIERRLGPAERDEPIFAETGVITFTAGNAKRVVGTEENSVIVSGGVTIQYWERERDQKLELTAERGVVFLKPDVSGDVSQFDKNQVLGIYLEGNVIATMDTVKGLYTIRSPRVFYSIKDDRALLIDAVFWTSGAANGLPLYVRAKTISQESANQFKATSATMTNTSFFEPDFSIGTQTLTLTQRTKADGTSRMHVDARNITLNAGPIPFFYWPILRGEPESLPLKDVRFSSSSGAGSAIKTVWNMYSLLGIDKEGNNQADLLLDWHFDRGEAFGTNLAWTSPTTQGGLFAYTFPEDRGREVLASGEKKTHDAEWRGVATFEHRMTLNEEWTIFAEASYVSDVTFLDGTFEDMAQQRRELTNSLYVRRIRENSLLSAEVRGTFNDFISNQYLIQSPGYVVEKLPEVGYKSIADDLISDSPGLLTYTSEYRLSRMQIKMSEPKANEFGYSDPTSSQNAFGITPGQSVADRLRNEGYQERPVDRFDTRHELGLQLAAGPVSVQPFVTGRVTAYDDNFSKYSPSNDGQHRLWGAEGITIATEMQHVDNGVESRLFDLHRSRHIVQPNLTVWHADTSLNRAGLPVYDDDVESLAEGTAAHMAVNQTWQTQRGGPGRWRSVDVIKWNSELFTSSADVDKESPVGRYIDYRPELSNLGGTFGATNATWQVTEVFGLGAATVYDFQTEYLAKTAVGATLRHAPDFQTYADLRTINSQDQTLFSLGANYELTPKYSLNVNGSYNTDDGVFQILNADIQRRYPSVILGLGVSYNNITHDTSLGIVITPTGTQRAGARLMGIGGQAENVGFGG